jgi:hypothetical protein
MKRAFVAAIALVAFTGAVAGCTDSVKGGMLFLNGGAGANVDARSGPLGENANGAATIESTGNFGPKWDWEVTCLNVRGKTAIVGVTGSEWTGYGWGETYPSAGLLRIVDGGGNASRLDTLEFATIEGQQDGPPIPGPTTCSEYPGDYGVSSGPHPNEDGDMVVTDVQPPPSTTQQCDSGGWRTYRFENQGQCDAFVAQFQR